MILSIIVIRLSTLFFLPVSIGTCYNPDGSAITDPDFQPWEQSRCATLQIALNFQMYVSRMACATIHVQRQVHAVVHKMGNIGGRHARIQPGAVRSA